MKNTMDKDTILFTFNNKKALAFNIDYFRLNHALHTDYLFDPVNIYYKLYDEQTSWSDYQRAIHNQSGSYYDRLLKAYADPEFKITNMKLIPACDYYDANGIKHEIPPFDGIVDQAFWLDRIVYDTSKITYEVTGDDLVVSFDKDITNAFVSLNSLFYPTELLNDKTVVFRNIIDRLPKSEMFGETIVNFKIDAYAWENLTKLDPLFPNARNGEYFYMEKPIEYNCIIIYNGTVLKYELDEENKSRFKINDLDTFQLENMVLDEMAVYQMDYDKPNMVARAYWQSGIGNRYKGTVDFTLPVRNSMILYNGIDAEYEIVDTNMVFYPETLFSVTEVTTLSFIQQVNFMLGM